MIRRPPRSPLFPYPTLFRSRPPRRSAGTLPPVCPRRAVREALRSGLSPPSSRVFHPGRRAGMVGRRSRAAPPAHSHRSAALVRSARTAVPAGAAAPLADRSVAHRHRRGAGMMSRQQSTDDVLLSVIVPAYNEAATIEATVRQLKQVPLRVEVIAVNDARSEEHTSELQSRL